MQDQPLATERERDITGSDSPQKSGLRRWIWFWLGIACVFARFRWVSGHGTIDNDRPLGIQGETIFDHGLLGLLLLPFRKPRKFGFGLIVGAMIALFVLVLAVPGWILHG